MQKPQNALRACMLCILSATLLFACHSSKQTLTEKKSIIHPPIPGLEMPFHHFEFEAEKGGHFYLPNGSNITVLPNSLLLPDGTRASGKVSLLYREFHKADDVYLSGIPMDVKDAKGKSTVLQTAGMFDMKAEQNGTELKIVDALPIQLQMASYVADTGYDAWAFNSNTGQWTDIGSSDTINNNSKKEKRKMLQSLDAGLAFPLDQHYFAFCYNALMDIHYGRDIYRVKPNAKAVLSKAERYGVQYSNINNWEDILYKGKYVPTSMLLWKNLSGMAIPKGKKEMEASLMKLDEDRYMMRIEDEKGKVLFNGKVSIAMTLQSLYRFPPEYWLNHYQQALAQIDSTNKYVELLADVYRNFEVKQFGIYNYDRCLNNNQSVEMAAKFSFDQEVDVKSPDFEIVYVGGDKRTVIKFPPTTWQTFAIMPDKGATMFALLPGNKIAIFDKSDFAKVDFAKIKSMPLPEFAFHLHTLSKGITKASDLNSILEI